MGSLYEALGLAAFDFKSINNPTYKFHINGPMWLLKLWLNATFESFMKFNILSALAQQVEGRRVKATSLALLTPEDVGLSIAYAFKKYVIMFTERDVFESSRAPFISQSHGPN